MERFRRLLIDVWREVGLHMEIEGSLARIAPILADRLPVRLIVIRRLDLPRATIETVACKSCIEGDLIPRFAKAAFYRDQIEAIQAWSLRGATWRGRLDRAESPIDQLMPEGIEGEVFVGPLARESEENRGVLLLIAPPGTQFTADHEPMFKALLDPFAAALSNHERLLEMHRLREAVEADNRKLLTRLDRQDISDSIIGAETGLRQVMERVDLVANSDAPVLILGETGSGKEVVARAIHYRSTRRDGPFLRVNCGAIPPELVDSELFGHERGSFTGATDLRKGWFERADGGTLFLDEVAELPLSAQVRLLRVLQDGTFERVGGQEQRHVDVRIVAATNVDLRSAVQRGTFREDLWYRVAVFPIHIPPLRERLEDIPALATHYALHAARRLGTASLAPTHNDLNHLLQYHWPGNVRELAAVIERAAILGNGRKLEIAKSLGVSERAEPGQVAESATAGQTRASQELYNTFALPMDSMAGGRPTLEELNRRIIKQALQQTNGRIEGRFGAALLLGINPNTLRSRMRKLAIDAREFRGS